MMDYGKVIEHKYKADRESFHLVTRPKLTTRIVRVNTGQMDEQGRPVYEDREIQGPSTDPAETETVIARWDLTDPQPTIEELDQYAASQEYLDLVAAERVTTLLKSVDTIIEEFRESAWDSPRYKAEEHRRKKTLADRWQAAGPGERTAVNFPLVFGEWSEYPAGYTLTTEAGAFPMSDPQHLVNCWLALAALAEDLLLDTTSVIRRRWLLKIETGEYTGDGSDLPALILADIAAALP